jgi:hypothetical protein
LAVGLRILLKLKKNFPLKFLFRGFKGFILSMFIVNFLREKIIHGNYIEVNVEL